MCKIYQDENELYYSVAQNDKLLSWGEMGNELYPKKEQKKG